MTNISRRNFVTGAAGGFALGTLAGLSLAELLEGDQKPEAVTREIETIKESVDPLVRLIQDEATVPSEPNLTRELIDILEQNSNLFSSNRLYELNINSGHDPRYAAWYPYKVPDGKPHDGRHTQLIRGKPVILHVRTGAREEEHRTLFLTKEKSTKYDNFIEIADPLQWGRAALIRKKPYYVDDPWVKVSTLPPEEQMKVQQMYDAGMRALITKARQTISSYVSPNGQNSLPHSS